MSSCARSMPTLRVAQSFTASAVKQPVRRLHITGPKELPSQYLKPAVASSHSKTPSTESSTVRTFNTTRSLKRPNDTSTIDFAFMPTMDSAAFAVGSVSTAALNIPILPDNYRAASAVAPMPVMSEAVAAEVETVSMALPGQVSVLSESDVGATHDGNAMDVFKVVETLHRKVEDVKVAAKEEAGVMREVFDGIFGDLIGGSKRLA